MFKQFLKQNTVTGLGTGLTGTARIPTVGTLYTIFLSIDATVAQVKAEINNILVKADGDEIINATPTFLYDLQKYYGDCLNAGNVDNVLPIFFQRLLLPTDSERSLYGLGLNDVDQLTVEIECGTLVNVTAISVWAVMTPEQRNMGQHIRIHKFPQNFPTTGQQEISTLPKGGASEGYMALHIEDSTGTIDDVTVKKGNYAIFNKVPAAINNVYLEHNHRTRQTGYYHVDFAAENDMTSLIPMANVKDWRIEITWSSAAPNNFNIYTERVFNLNVAAK